MPQQTPETATEWVLTPENVNQLWNLIGPSKPHQSYPHPNSRHLQVDGLTIWPHAGKPRTWARFGDRITLDADGTYTVHHASPED